MAMSFKKMFIMLLYHEELVRFAAQKLRQGR